jgi:hypothetical protein
MQITLEGDDFRADVKQIRFHPRGASIISSTQECLRIVVPSRGLSVE